MVPPVPIPNTEVKRLSADDTERATSCGKYATARGLHRQVVSLERRELLLQPLTFIIGCFIIIDVTLAMRGEVVLRREND